MLLDLVGGEERLCRSVKTDGRLAYVLCPALDDIVHGRLAKFNSLSDDFVRRRGDADRLLHGCTMSSALIEWLCPRV